MKPGYTIKNHIWDGAECFMLFNWEHDNTIELHGRINKIISSDTAVGIWKLKKLKS